MADTALSAHLAALGAVLADDRGVRLPQRFGVGPAKEYAALRSGAALLDLGFRTLVRVLGEDRVQFLQGMLTNDVSGLVPGAGCSALLLTVQGRVTADVRVAMDRDAVTLDVDLRVQAGLLDALARLVVADDVELMDPPAPVAMIGIEGPGAASLVPGTAELAPFAHAALPVAGVLARVQRASEVGGPGLTVAVPVEKAATVWDALVGSGAVPCGMEALEGRRIETGVPRIGLDMDGSTLALEVPVEDCISQTKGCYLGQEVVARGTGRGHVNRRLVGLRLEGPVPPAGAPLVCEGREVGRLTSVGWAFGAGGAAALGFVRREHWAPGTELAVPHGQAGTRARVADLPLA